MTSVPCSAESHESCDADVCFKAKMAHWKRHGAPAVTFQGGRKFFGGHQTIHERQAQIVEEARRKGNEAIPAAGVFGN